MKQNLSKTKQEAAENQPLTNILAKVMYNVYGAHTCKYLVGGGGGVQLLSHV